MNEKYRRIAVIATLSIALSLFLLGCYRDLGNYTYAEDGSSPQRRTLTLFFSPTDYADNIKGTGIVEFRIEQPSGTDSVLLPFVGVAKEITKSQTNSSPNQENTATAQDVQYLWREIPQRGYNRRDTIYGDTLRLRLAPNKQTDTLFIFEAKDLRNDLQYYAKVRIRTVRPYVNSWFLLQQADTANYIGAARRSENGFWVKKDLFQSAPEDVQTRIHKAIAIDVNSFGNGYMGTPALSIYTPDYMCTYKPIENMKLGKVKSQMISPTEPEEASVFETAVNSQTRSDSPTYTINQAKELFYSPGLGIYYRVKPSKDIANYKAHNVLVQGNMAYVYDDFNKKIYQFRCPFFLYRLPATRQEKQNRTQMVELTVNGYAEMNLKDLSFVTSFINSDGDDFYPEYIFQDKNGQYISYALLNDEDTKDSKMTPRILYGLNIPAGASWAVSEGYRNQYFLVAGSTVYRYDRLSHRMEQIYQVPGAEGVCIKFKLLHSYDPFLMNKHKEDYPLERTIGVAFNHNGKGELHELLLNESGEVASSTSYTEFFPIRDLRFCILLSNI